MRWRTLSLLTVGLWALVASPAGAYIDPGTGSYLFQILIAAGLAAVVTVKTYWRRVLDFVKNRLSEED